MHGRLYNELSLEIAISPQTPLLIKSGQKASIDPALPDMQFVRTRRRLADNTTEEVVYIPGSSLRGVVRAHAERLLRTVNEKYACYVEAKKFCLRQNQKEVKEDEEPASRLYRESCYACRLFGNTGVHIGMGYSDFVKADNQEYFAALQASKSVREGDTLRRQYLIPGSSIKGAVRSIVEAITCSCVCITKSAHHSHLPEEYRGCASVNALCTACRLFGAQDYQGHLRFEDAIAPRGTLVLLHVPVLWEPARGKRGLPPRYLLENGAAKGRKFYFHALCAPGNDPRTCIKSGAELPHASTSRTSEKQSWACCSRR